MLFYEIDLSRGCSESYRFINHNPSWIICVTGDRQNITFSPGSGTQTASRFSSTSCRGSSYFSCCWPWWRPSLGRPPVPACRTSTGTPPIQCKSAPYFCFFFFRLFAPHLFRVIIFYHAETLCLARPPWSYRWKKDLGDRTVSLRIYSIAVHW